MAKRMQFSVVGLPHYTIWHLYEPSVDDLRHMEEMEVERQQREEKEKEEKEADAERPQKSKDRVKDSKKEWDKDGTAAVVQKIDKSQTPQEDGQQQKETAEEKASSAAKGEEDAIPRAQKEDPKDKASDKTN
jgi:mannan polymerase II complex ANP1 subunit